MEYIKDQIPILISVRKQSERCPNKVCRDFYDGKSLTEIALEKFKGRKDVYLSAYEDEFKDIADKYEVNFLPRPYESAMGETQEVIRGYLKDTFPYEQILSYNVCCPFTKTETADKAIETYKKANSNALFLVYSFFEVVLDHHKKPLTPDALVFNSKMRRPQYKISNNFIIMNMKTFWERDCQVIENFEEEDACFYEIEEMETLDIDTEAQFRIVQSIYRENMK